MVEVYINLVRWFDISQKGQAVSVRPIGGGFGREVFPLPTLGENGIKKLNWATLVTFKIIFLAYVKQRFATIYKLVITFC